MRYNQRQPTRWGIAPPKHLKAMKQLNPNEYIKVGHKARYSHTYHDFWGCPTSTDNDIVMVKSIHDGDGHFCKPTEANIAVIVRSNGTDDWADISDLYPCFDLSELSEEQFEQIRKDICIGSLYLSDYANTYGVDENTLCSICDSYIGWLAETYGEENWEQHDTPKEFAEYIYNN